MNEGAQEGRRDSFRLTMEAAEIVDNINYPRRLGGKSKKVSEAIEWYFGHEDVESLLAGRIFWMRKYEDLKNTQSEPKVPAWYRRFFR